MNYEITPQELRQRQERNEELLLLDVRELWERQTASIMPSQHIPMADVPVRVKELDPESAHHRLLSSWRAFVLGYRVAAQEGYQKVQSMSGGIEQWSRQIDPNVPRY